MRKVAILAIAGVVAAGMSLAAAPAGASVAAKSSKKFCKAVTSSFEEIQSGSSDVGKKTAASIAKALNKAAKSAPSNKVKKATKTLAGFYERIANGDSPAEVFRDEAEAYTKAATTFTTAYFKRCTPNITLPSIPDITIPKITIPGG